LPFKLVSRFKAEIVTINFSGQKLILAKPTTQMNLSGYSVKELMDYYQCHREDLWVICDDLNLAFGRIRLRTGGSSGGHHGLESIIEQIGGHFKRIRIGIKNRQFTASTYEDFVLDKFNAAEQTKLPTVLNRVNQVIIQNINSKQFLSQTIDALEIANQ